MKFLRIAGNAISRGVKKAVAIATGCCKELWKDLEIWDDECLWKEPNCGEEIWENGEVWNNECPWPGTPEGFPYTFPLELD